MPPTPNDRTTGWFQQTMLIAAKDLRAESRAGGVLATSVFFSVLVTTACVVAFSPAGGSDETNGSSYAVAVWAITTFFSSLLIVQRIWQREHESGVLQVVFSLPCHPSAIFAAKAAVVMLFLAAVQLVTLVLLALFVSVDPFSMLTDAAVVALFCLPAIGCGATFWGAAALASEPREWLISIVFLPLLLPVLMTAVAASNLLRNGATLLQIGDYIALLVVFDVVHTAAGLGLFASLVRD